MNPAGAPSIQPAIEVRLRAFVFSACCFTRECTMNPAGAPSNSLTEVRLCASVFSTCESGRSSLQLPHRSSVACVCFFGLLFHREFTMNPAGAPSHSLTEVRLRAFVFSAFCFIRECTRSSAARVCFSGLLFHTWI